MNKAIFLDRDGTIIEECGYICHLSESEIFSFTPPAIRMMNEQGYKVFIITNQSSIARGICKKEEIEAIHKDIDMVLEKQGAIIDRYYYCPFLSGANVPDYQADHPWRKPRPGMLLQAASDFNIDLKDSFMIGDDVIDIQAGKHAGCKTVLVLTGKGFDTLEKLKSQNLLPDIITDNILTFSRQYLIPNH